ncbi:unnamed protein product [Prorocentrum cordatum]|uniref:Endonuclease/exonuclease/phosphatase domain-containing protein n=1 Tax=Prorocentrum cordatum TaxID=2364126 RepID=A0ABN9UQG8_9DINO|nr:unnamed protein product [Polarella glacialis]
MASGLQWHCGQCGCRNNEGRARCRQAGCVGQRPGKQPSTWESSPRGRWADGPPPGKQTPWHVRLVEPRRAGRRRGGGGGQADGSGGGGSGGGKACSDEKLDEMVAYDEQQWEHVKPWCPKSVQDKVEHRRRLRAVGGKLSLDGSKLAAKADQAAKAVLAAHAKCDKAKEQASRASQALGAAQEELEKKKKAELERAQEEVKKEYCAPRASVRAVMEKVKLVQTNSTGKSSDEMLAEAWKLVHEVLEVATAASGGASPRRRPLPKARPRPLRLPSSPAPAAAERAAPSPPLAARRQRTWIRARSWVSSPRVTLLACCLSWLTTASASAPWRASPRWPRSLNGGGQEHKTGTMLPHGGRHWRCLSVNATAYSSFETHLERRDLRLADLARVQETHLGEERGREMEGQLQRLGWHARATPGSGVRPGHPGSGGLPMMAPKRLAVGSFEGDAPSAVVPARAAVLRVNAVCPGGIAWGNVYLLSGVGLCQENLGALGRLAERLVTLGKPFVAAGDWNLEPSELADSPFLRRVRGAVVAPARGTCEPALRVLDYFVVSQHLVKARGEVLRGWAVTPHWPAQLTIRSGDIDTWARVPSGRREPRWRPRVPTRPGSTSSAARSRSWWARAG